MAERMQNMTPEQRDQMMARMRGRGGDGGASVGGRRGQAPGAPPAPAAGRGNATTIDALFGPLPQVETRGQVWLHTDKELRPVRVRLGISDGQMTELIEGDVEPGVELVTNINTGTEAVRTQPGFGGFPPFMGPGGRGGDRGGGPGGNRGGGGGGNNRGGGGR
jgi:hypothetical protein